MTELKDDERVVANKVVQNNKKGTEKIKRKKNQQINELMKNSDEEDIRGWVNNIEEDESEEDSDEIDDVKLSSGDQEEDEDE